ncbi:MAG: helix-turn-helix domain-containing protein [Bacteroidota bacterium]
MAISRANLANIVGTSKECVIRVLPEFKSDELITTRKSKIKILEPEKLANFRY